jgi:hypothetical protein
MKKISPEDGPLAVYKWSVGDLVKIKNRDWDAITDTYSTGVVTEITTKEADKQQFMFPLVSVYDFKLQKINKAYPSNLEIISSIK